MSTLKNEPTSFMNFATRNIVVPINAWHQDDLSLRYSQVVAHAVYGIFDRGDLSEKIYSRGKFVAV